MNFMTNEGSIYVYLWHYTVANMQLPLSIYNKTPFMKNVAQNIFKRTKYETSTWHKCLTFEWIMHLFKKAIWMAKYFKPFWVQDHLKAWW